MKFILKSAYLFFVCLFFTVNIYAQTTKKILQTFAPAQTVQAVKISSSVDSSTVDKWAGDFILIYVEIKAKGMGAVNSYKAEYRQQGNTVIINLNPNLPQVIASGKPAPTIVEYEIFVPETLNIIEE